MERVDGAPPGTNGGAGQAAEGRPRRHEAGVGVAVPERAEAERAGSESESAEEAEHGRRPVELPESAAEIGAGDEAEPGPADVGGAEEARRVVRRKPEEDRLDEIVHQPRHMPLS